jgi:hypothetical protein
MRNAEKIEEKRNANIEKTFETRVAITDAIFGAAKIAAKPDVNIAMKDVMPDVNTDRIQVAG